MGLMKLKNQVGIVSDRPQELTLLLSAARITNASEKVSALFETNAPGSLRAKYKELLTSAVPRSLLKSLAVRYEPCAPPIRLR